MSADITILPTARRKINEAAIKLLEDVLEDVRAGNVEAVALITVKVGGGFNHAFTPSEHATVMLGATTYLKHRLCLAVDTTEQDG